MGQLEPIKQKITAMRLNENVAISENGFVFNAARGDSFSTNPTGREILEMLQAGKSPDEIKAHLMKAYKIDSMTVDKDLYDFITLLEQLSLIER